MTAPNLTPGLIGAALDGHVVDIDGTPDGGSVGFVHQGTGDFRVTLFDDHHNDITTRSYRLVETP